MKLTKEVNLSFLYNLKKSSCIQIKWQLFFNFTSDKNRQEKNMRNLTFVVCLLVSLFLSDSLFVCLSCFDIHEESEH